MVINVNVWIYNLMHINKTLPFSINAKMTALWGLRFLVAMHKDKT